MSATRPGFGVVIPVKPPAVAKSRLAGLGVRARQELVVAFASDTVTAALACPLVQAVVVVTDDHRLARGIADLGAHVLPDSHADDLNGSLTQAAAEVERRWPELRITALCADLPALRSAELARVLEEVPSDRQSFLPDADRVGTTLVAAPSTRLFDPRFGTGSRGAHLDLGAFEIDLPDVESVRRDVDTPADLAAALRLGVGPRTSQAVTGLTL